MERHMDETGDYCDYEVDEVLPILSPEEAFARVPDKPCRQVCCLRVGVSERFEEAIVDGELVLFDLPGEDVRHFVQALYHDEWSELLYWGTDPGAAWTLARRVSAAYRVPIERWEAAPRQTDRRGT
jgi:hypothetical protein